MSFTIPGDVDPEKFMPWINDISQVQGPNILRSKGILAFKDEPRRFVFQGVHMMMGGDMGKPWAKNEAKESVLVFIGKKLPKDLFIAGLEECLAK